MFYTASNVVLYGLKCYVLYGLKCYVLHGLKTEDVFAEAEFSLQSHFSAPTMYNNPFLEQINVYPNLDYSCRSNTWSSNIKSILMTLMTKMCLFF